jgi:hypothetical protein
MVGEAFSLPYRIALTVWNISLYERKCTATARWGWQRAAGRRGLVRAAWRTSDGGGEVPGGGGSEVHRRHGRQRGLRMGWAARSIFAKVPSARPPRSTCDADLGEKIGPPYKIGRADGTFWSTQSKTQNDGPDLSGGYIRGKKTNQS